MTETCSSGQGHCSLPRANCSNIIFTQNCESCFILRSSDYANIFGYNLVKILVAPPLKGEATYLLITLSVHLFVDSYKKVNWISKITKPKICLQTFWATFDYLTPTLPPSPPPFGAWSRTQTDRKMPPPGFGSNIQWTLLPFNIALSIYLSLHLSVCLSIPPLYQSVTPTFNQSITPSLHLVSLCIT